VVSDISHIQHAAFFSGEKSPNGDTASEEFLAKIPLFPKKNSPNFTLLLWGRVATLSSVC
jgi:hypothetical protein